MELSQGFANIAAARGSKSGSMPVLPVIDTAIILVIDISVLPISAANITIFEPDATLASQIPQLLYPSKRVRARFPGETLFEPRGSMFTGKPGFVRAFAYPVVVGLRAGDPGNR